jgi:hypothetical protein
MKSALAILFLAATAVAQPQGDKPLEETKKNIKVLRGVPSSQLIPIMTIMANSLGVTCSYCHEPEWESDARPEKEAGRRMLRLTRMINDQQYEGRGVVSCNTCHRGHVATVAAPDIADAGWNKPRHESHVDASLPAAEELLAKNLRAWGSIDGVRNRRSTGIATALSGRGDPRSAAFELFQELPNTVKLTLDLPYPGEANREFTSQFFNAMKLRDRYAAVKTTSVRPIRGRDAYLAEATPKEGPNRETLWFDAATGLLLRREIVTPTIIGPLPQQYDFDDYRSIGGAMVPFFLQWSRGDYQITHRFATVTQNVEPK